MGVCSCASLMTLNSLIEREDTVVHFAARDEHYGGGKASGKAGEFWLFSLHLFGSSRALTSRFRTFWP